MKLTHSLGATPSTGPQPSAVSEDGYRLLGVDFILATDSKEVREFFRSAYRRFRLSSPVTGDPLRLVAMMEAINAGPFVSAGDKRLDLSGRPMPENRAFLFLLNALMDRVGDFFLVHGAALRVGERGIVIAGRPGSGKSTLAVELARRGAVLMSDDVAALSRQDGRLQPFPRAIGIRRDGRSLAGFDPASIPDDSCHGLPHKWLVQAETLGIEVSDADGPSCSLDTVVLLDVEERTGTGRQMEIALAEEEASILQEIRQVPGLSNLRRVKSDYPLFRFSVEATGRPMKALSSICSRRADVVLYVDEARPEKIVRREHPLLEEADSRELLMAVAADLLNRSDTGALVASCGGLAGLLTELGRHLGRARNFRLRPGLPGETAAFLFSLLESDDTGEVIQ